jgi:hypothetical protein
LFARHAFTTSLNIQPEDSFVNRNNTYTYQLHLPLSDEFGARPRACWSRAAVRRRANAKRTMKRRPNSATVLALKRTWR